MQTYLRLGKYDEAVASAAEFRDIFGAGQLLRRADGPRAVDREPGPGRPAQDRPDLQLPLVATNDLHYAAAADAAAHEVLLCVQTGATMADANRFKFEGDGYYLKSPAEMRALFADLPEACDNTLAIAERCDVSFTEGNGTFMPRYPCPPGENEESWFVREVERGLQRALSRPASPTRPAQRAEFETEVILLDGLRRLLPGRRRLHQLGQGATASGSARVAARAPGRSPRTRCGSPTSTRCVHGLLFERFLNPERVSMPDFDIDFDERRRGEVIRYVTEKYGDDRVSQIVTYGTIKAKQAVKDASRVLGYPFGMGERITKAMPPPVMGKDVPLAKIFDPERQAVRRGRGVPRAVRVRRRRQDRGRHRQGPGGPEAAVGGARRRRDHVLASR